MPIEIKLAIREGWKANENKRFGEVFEVRFLDTKSGKILFRYAPTCKDKTIWLDIFERLEDYDGTLIQLRAIIEDIDGNTYQSRGDDLDVKERSN